MDESWVRDRRLSEVVGAGEGWVPAQDGEGGFLFYCFFNDSSSRIKQCYRVKGEVSW